MMRFAVIGHPVAHSLSPAMHAANFASLGLDAEYSKFDVEPGGVAAFVRARRDEGYVGLNVTVPHKKAVLALLDTPDESVRRYGSCNTLKFEADGTISGSNTDVAGFLSCLSAHGVALSGARVLVVGCGGAGSALAKACVLERAATVSVSARTFATARELAVSLAELAAIETTGTSAAAVPAADVGALYAAACAADVIVNATPVGLQPGDGSVVPAGAFRKGQFVLDIIPTRELPPTAAAALAAGASAAGGLEFLVEQGARSFEIWTGLKADRSAMLAAVGACAR